MRIESIADHLDRVGTIARWYWDEWGAYLDPTGSVEGWAAGLRERTNRDRLPTMYVALVGGELLGVAGLIQHDMSTHPELSPWLSGVYVKPAVRKQGVASALVRHVVRQAGIMGFPRLFLFTPDARTLYERLGWNAVGDEEYAGERVTIMAIEIVGLT